MFKDYTISCFKGNTKIFSNDSFTHKIETISQIELILERLQEAEHYLPEELT